MSSALGSQWEQSPTLSAHRIIETQPLLLKATKLEVGYEATVGS
jgi:hypothetical protein